MAKRKLRLAWVVARMQGMSLAECNKIVEQAEVEYRWVEAGESLPEKDLV